MRAKRYAIALTALMLGLATLAGAGSAAPANPDVGARLTSAAAATEPAQPPNLHRLADGEIPGEIGFDDITQVVNKQKLKIKLPPQAFMTYQQTCVMPFPDFFISIDRFGGLAFSCSRAGDVVRHGSTLLPLEAWIGNGLSGIAGDTWVQSPADAERPFGTFAPVRVRALAFGSVPITATVHISQSMRDGLIQPLHFEWSATGGYVPEGVVIPGYGLAPGYPYAFQFPPKFDGPLDIRLSDVEVDGVPLPVSSGCVAPGDLTMTPKPGYYSTDYVTTPPTKGMPGEFAPLYLYGPAYLSGTVDIKAFQGCRNGGEHLDALLTGMISGAGNPIDTTMSQSLRAWCEDLFGTPHIGKVYCDIGQTPLEGQPATALRAMGLAATKQSTPEAKKPSASDVRKLRNMDTKGMSKPIRELWIKMMKSLPPTEAR